MTLVERRRPARLRVGSRVAVVAPAGPVPPELLDAGVALLRSWGLRVEVGRHVREQHAGFDYLAGGDASRGADLQRAWCDPNVDAVFCARGGYGCLRMLDHVDWAVMAQAPPKVFAGSSDITALHDAFAAHLDVVTLFSPMIGTAALIDDPVAQEHLRLSLFEPEAVSVLTRPGAQTLVSGHATGVTVGGNASLVVSALGAHDAPPPPHGGIVLLEDVTEEPYRLDRIITQLLRAGWFDAVAGIALGSWTSCGDLSQVRELMVDRLGGLGVPIVWELGFGHCERQLTVPLGVAAELDADAATLTVKAPALR
ncbi:MAG: LD-carboxypeptidase [Kutzneria sp.]|nr:LD-carboxypeptidase [Kutzneria sp.]MBV9844263.1 LD-carboxypeptidase [Kutzneria sp.]